MVNSYSIQRLTPAKTHDFQLLIQLFQIVFEAENRSIPSFDYLKQRLEQPNFHVFIILDHTKIIGGLTAFELPSYYRPKSEIFIYDIAIDINYQRQGIGTFLLNNFRLYCKENGFGEVFLDASKADPEAVNFYKKNNGQAEEVIQFTFF